MTIGTSSTTSTFTYQTLQNMSPNFVELRMKYIWKIWHYLWENTCKIPTIPTVSRYQHPITLLGLPHPYFPFPSLAAHANTLSLHLKLIKATVLAESSLYFIFSLGALHSSDIYRCESGRCHTLPFFLAFFYQLFNFTAVLKSLIRYHLIHT
jgi:hypothetical protein